MKFEVSQESQRNPNFVCNGFLTQSEKFFNYFHYFKLYISIHNLTLRFGNCANFKHLVKIDITYVCAPIYRSCDTPSNFCRPVSNGILSSWDRTGPSCRSCGRGRRESGDSNENPSHPFCTAK